ncbi:MAG: AAA family ATPase [Acidobacteria bacterium]|nr:AAA family ATPase [Acidobacteriota bacterium]
MIRRFYVNNFRCLENFELPIAGQSSVLLIGKNGSGKSTVACALQILQTIARGTSRVGEVIKAKDFTGGRLDVPVRFEIEVELGGSQIAYMLAIEGPGRVNQLHIKEEWFAVDGVRVFSREFAEARSPGDTQFIKWDLAALPLVQNPSILAFTQWFSRLLLLRPVPSMISGNSEDETHELFADCTNVGAWFSAILTHAPRAYGQIEAYLHEVIPDFDDIRNPVIGKGAKTLVLSFRNDLGTLPIPFQDLSDGEKCFVIAALVLAANESYGPLFCFWDEPDNYLAIDEVGHFVTALRKAFHNRGQFIATSHNPEAIRSFSEGNTLYLHRKSHLEPTIVRRLSELQVNGPLVDALIRGDVEP